MGVMRSLLLAACFMAASAGAARVEVEVRPPSATVIGEVAFKPESAIPKVVTASLVNADAKEPAEQAVACAMEARRFRCTIPARRALHLKVIAEGFAPLYLWDIDAREGEEVSVGIHDLVRGGSVLGRVLTASGRPAAKAEVRLVPIGAAEQAPSERAATTLRTRTNAAGLFQLAGVEAGVYRVISTLDGFADAVHDRIEVRQGAEARLAAALMHLERGRVDVAIQPPVSHTQQPWSVKLRAYGPRLNEVRTIAEGTASQAGFWSVGKLEPGSYRVVVVDAAGSNVAEQNINVRGGVENVFITVTAVQVEGIVSAERPIATDIEFNRPGQRVRTKSDEEGRFVVSFPTEGEWRPALTVGSRRVMLPAVKIAAGSTVELKVPGGAVNGHVRDDRGDAVWAMITLYDERHSIVAQVPTEADGAFVIEGIDAGSYAVEADAENATAGPLPLDVSEDEASEIELRVMKQRKVRGTVMTMRGVAASGASVRIFDPVTRAYETRIADAKGMFSFSVRGHAQNLSLIVVAPPHPVAMRDVAAGEKDIAIQLAPAGATLRVYVYPGPPWPTIRAGGGMPLPMSILFAPDFGGGTWPENVNGAFELNVAPGPHVVCFKELCETVQLAPGTVGVVDYSPVRLAREGK